MTTRLFLLLLAVAAGIGQPFQTAMNARLRESVRVPTLAALISLVVSAVLVAIATASGASSGVECSRRHATFRGGRGVAV